MLKTSTNLGIIRACQADLDFSAVEECLFKQYLHFSFATSIQVTFIETTTAGCSFANVVIVFTCLLLGKQTF